MGARYTHFDSKETLLGMILHTVAESVRGDVLAALCRDSAQQPRKV